MDAAPACCDRCQPATCLGLNTVKCSRCSDEAVPLRGRAERTAERRPSFSNSFHIPQHTHTQSQHRKPPPEAPGAGLWSREREQTHKTALGVSTSVLATFTRASLRVLTPPERGRARSESDSHCSSIGVKVTVHTRGETCPHTRRQATHEWAWDLGEASGGGVGAVRARRRILGRGAWTRGQCAPRRHGCRKRQASCAEPWGVTPVNDSVRDTCPCGGRERCASARYQAGRYDLPLGLVASSRLFELLHVGRVHGHTDEAEV